MSCVVGLISENKVWIGADGIATTEDGEKRPIVINKITRNKKYIFGCTGSVRVARLLSPKMFEPPEDIDFLPDALIKLLADRGTLVTTEQNTVAMPSNILVACKSDNRLYEVMIDFQLNEILGDYTAIGSGSSYALGAFKALEKIKMKPKERMSLALDAASEFLVSCGPPYTFESL